MADVRYKFDPANPPPLTEAMKVELEAIAALPDDSIDLSDMPEVTDWSDSTRGKFYRPVKQQVTLRIDADILHWFKTRQGGERGYQTQINAALRAMIDGERRKA